MTAAALSLILPWLAGWGVLQLAATRRPRSLLENAARAFLLGRLVLALGYLGLSWTVGRVSAPTLGGLLGALALAGAAARLAARQRRRRRSARPGEATPPAPRPRLAPRAPLEFAPALAAACLWAVIAAGTLTSPLEGYDGWANYGARARTMLALGALGPEFLARDLPHQDYPPLIPIGLAWPALVAGGWDERLVQLHLPLYLAAGMLVLAGTLARYLGRAAGWGGAFLLAATPQIFRYASNSECDVPLAIFVLAALASWWEAMRSGDRLAEPVLFLAAAAWTKNEGTAYAAVLLAVHAVWWLARRRAGVAGGWMRLAGVAGGWMRLAGPAAGLAALAWPWWAIKAAFGLTNEGLNAQTLTLAYWLGQARNLPLMARSFAYNMMYSADGGAWEPRWLIGWPAFALALALWLVRPGRRALAPLAAMLVLALALLVAVAAASPLPPDVTIRNVIDRVVLHLFPAALLFTLLVFGREFRGTAYRDP